MNIWKRIGGSVGTVLGKLKIGIYHLFATKMVNPMLVGVSNVDQGEQIQILQANPCEIKEVMMSNDPMPINEQKSSNYVFGTISRENLNTCHLDLQLIAEESLKVSQVDFGIMDGFRSIEKQQQYFEMGKSKCDGIIIKSKHNYNPSMAFDIRIYVSNKPELTYNIIYLSYMGGVITSVAKRLLSDGKIKCRIRWGGNWNSNNEIMTDQTFQDFPHFEIVEIG